MQLFMEAQAEVLGQVLGEDSGDWEDWLNDNEAHGEHLRELLARCYSKDEHLFPAGCVSGVVATLQQEIEEEKSILH